LSGGLEPLSYPSIETIINVARERGITISLFTNGTEITPGNLSLITALSKVDSICISLRAACPGKHVLVTRTSKENFTRLIDGCRFLAALKRDKGYNYRFHCAFFIVPENISELDNILDLAVDTGFETLNFSVDNLASERHFSRPEQGLISEKLVNIIDTAQASNNNIVITCNDYLNRQIAISRGKNNPIYRYQLREVELCTNPLFRPAIDPFGDVYRCSFISNPYYANKDALIGNALENPLTHLIKRAMVSPSAFAHCPSCNPSERNGMIAFEKLRDDYQFGVPLDRQPYVVKGEHIIRK
jgi:MoaA/NifB/PqqE/SkfB family radical SAM enzyme